MVPAAGDWLRQRHVSFRQQLYSGVCYNLAWCSGSRNKPYSKCNSIRGENGIRTVETGRHRNCDDNHQSSLKKTFSWLNEILNSYIEYL